MKKIFKLHMMMFLVIVAIISRQTSFAEENINRLIMSEIYLDENDPSKNWIEVYNPTDNPLTLIRLRLSTLLTPNILPPEYKDGIILSANEKIIICADKDFLGSVSQSGITIIEAEYLKVTRSGGFLAIANKENTSIPIDVMRYGSPYRSDHVKAFSEIQVIPLANNGRSYSRTIRAKNGSVSITDFFKSAQSPGEITVER